MLENPSALLCFDFDGTLVDDTPDWNSISLLMEAIEGLRGAGAAWVLNTGRSLPFAMDGLRLHGLTNPPDFLIAREGEIYILNEMGRWADLGDWNARMARAARRFIKTHLKFFRLLRNWLRANTKSQWISEAQEPAGIIATSNEEMDRICEWIDEARVTWPDLCYQRASIYLRFSPPGYNKGSALAELAFTLDIPVSHRFAIGDGHNDLSMLRPEIAGCLACPSNSVQPVLAQVHEAGGYRSDAASTLGCLEAIQFYFFD